MTITITVPELKCARCETTAAIQPRLLYMQSRIPREFRDVFSAVIKERPDMDAVDSNGQTWTILADSKPSGWMKGPQDSNLCEACGALWAEAGKTFMVPPPPPVVDENPVVGDLEPSDKQETETAIPAESYPRRKQQLHGARYR